MNSVLRMRWLVALLVAVAMVLLVAVAMVRTRLQDDPNALFVSDAFGYYLYLPSIVIDGDLDFSNQIVSQKEQADHSFYQTVPETGLPGNAFQVGCALLWSPVFLATHLAVLAANALGRLGLSTTGLGPHYEWPVYVAAFAIGLIGVYYTFRLLKELYGYRVAAWTMTAICLGSPLAAYLWFEPGMSHAASMSLISILLYHLHRAHQTHDLHWATWAKIGILCGLIASVRATDVFIGIPVAGAGLAIAWRSWRRDEGDDRTRIPLAANTVVLCAVLTFIPQMLVWRTLYGGYVSLPSGTNYSNVNWLNPDLAGYLFGPSRGVFTWAPVWGLGLVGLAIGSLRGRWAMLICLLCLLGAVYFTSCTHAWWSGSAFGPRRMADYSALFAVGLGYLLSLRPHLTRKTRLAVVGVVIGFNLLLLVRYYTHDLPEYGAVSFHELYVDTLRYPARVVSGLSHGQLPIRETWTR